MRERVLFHQIHPLKLATDLSAEIVSLVLFWQHALVPALVVHLVPPVVASGLLLRFADLEPQRASAFGRYVERAMTPAMQAVRLAGDVVTVVGAWLHEPLVIALGAGIVAFGWLRGRLVAR